MKLFGKNVTWFNIIGIAIGVTILLLTFFLGFLPVLDTIWGWVGLIAFFGIFAVIAIPPAIPWLVNLFKR